MTIIISKEEHILRQKSSWIHQREVVQRVVSSQLMDPVLSPWRRHHHGDSVRLGKEVVFDGLVRHKLDTAVDGCPQHGRLDATAHRPEPYTDNTWLGRQTSHKGYVYSSRSINRNTKNNV